MAVVTRVLPWRRDHIPPVAELEPLIAKFRGRNARRAVALVTEAFELAREAHDGQMRRSGELYITHPLAVAMIVAEQTEDPETIAAALLHDAVEDTAITLADIEERFTPSVATIVDGVTKLERVHFPSKEAQQAATMRKLLVAMAKDLRVLIIKLADRLHNMRTIAAMPAHKQQRIARETLDVYAPLAHRLGMQDIRVQLEDLSFACLHPKRYAEIDHMVASRTPEREIYLTQVIEEVRSRLTELGIVAEVTGRPKHLWSIYEKMVVKGKEFSEIFDLVGVRVLVGSVKDCYAALGSIHSTWKPVQGRFKDFIAMPKFNDYQSLHTTVIGPQGKTLEVQIRTHDMNVRSEYGVAAHWRYKARDADLDWLNRIVDWTEETDDPSEFMANLKTDLDHEEIMVFTPKGDVRILPAGATPIDFAYTIHTEIGHACIGTRVDGRLVSLYTKLRSGDTVEIFTSKTPDAGPSREWLDVVVSPRAKNKIRQWFSREERTDAIGSGREELEKALRHEGLPVQHVLDGTVLERVATTLNYSDPESLFLALGEGHVTAATVASRAARELRHGDPAEDDQLPTTAQRPRRHSRERPTVGVHLEGMDDVLVRLARCCTPVPDDDIIGFHTRGRGVSVHRADCANAVSLAASQTDRLVEVEWDTDRLASYLVSIDVEALDRARLLSDVSSVLADHHINILSCTTTTGADRISKMRFEFELSEPSHLASVLALLRGIEGVFDVHRVLPNG
ncbi:MAG: bifunctional (p)ppGpp synthetase/guanosine-3',5'-bis(diphosphate) 3'-pyrophosphohydrolase [Actinomycetota bacterium]|nr:bifunctional (p)ppGpp synthetase/guanosine-3',5'-bis(diphosphate) 3'-pyrophosphohydrolase [Actinomycetota bacterium]